MPSQELLSRVAACASEFDVKAVWLFGSALEDESSARDIDLAVEGIDRRAFFRFYAKLDSAFEKPVDLVDLDDGPPIGYIVRARGVRVYER
jgi:predicted nucleotidyltransferase